MENLIKSIWEEQRTVAEGITSRKQVNRTGVLPCFIGTAAVTRMRFLIIQIPAAIPIPPEYLRQFRGVEIYRLPAKENLTELALFQADPALNSIFELLTADILKNIVVFTDPILAVRQLMECLTLWRRLFERLPGQGLSPEEQTGLYGELFFLFWMIQKGISAAVALNSWTGPQKKEKDFSLGSCSVEVKTSRRMGSNPTISSEQQLNLAGWEQLFLAVFYFDVRTGNGSTLPSLVDLLSAVFRQNSFQETHFYNLLSQAGYWPEQADLYKETEYRLTDRRAYGVTADFPKLTDDTIPSGVSRVSYELSLAACEPYRTTEISLLSYLKNNDAFC